MTIKTGTITLALVLLCGLVVAANGQCILSNPSFEITGSGGPVFGGWNQFGTVGSTPIASHGHLAARVSGPNSGTWDMSGFWQSQDCTPGEQWVVTGEVINPANRALTGQNAALVNVEWRDSGGVLIDFDSFNVANAASPQDAYFGFSRTTAPAPEGTVSARVLVGTLQSPTDPVSDVYFDQITFFSTSAPTIDDRQWTDFPGGRTLDFAGRTWRVKGPGYFGPGPNVFSDAADRVWVDGSQELHLTLTNNAGTWQSTEVVLEQPLGYGDYILTTVGPLNQLDPQAVLGIFLWEYGNCWDPSYLWWNPYNEIDIEYSRWQDPNRDLAQFVAQPFDWPGNMSRFDATFGPDEVVSHAMRWREDRVDFRVWRGGPQDESAANMVYSWTYNGPHIPRPEQPRLHLNLWRLDGAPSSEQTVVFSDFNFVPAGAVSSVGDEHDSSVPGQPSGWLNPAVPNPFNPQTTLSFTLDRSGVTELKIYGLNGGLVRTLLSETLAAGQYSRAWDGRDNTGRVVASGVYLVRLGGPDFQESQRVVLLK